MIWVLAALRAAVAAGIGVAALSGYRWIARQSRVLGFIVAAAILIRAVLGLAMFWTSYLHLPIATSLQLGNGFWAVALDATGYFQLGTEAAEAHRWYPLDHSQPAPLFLNVFTAWLRLVGLSPAAGLFLNLCLYLAVVAAAVWFYQPTDDWRADLPALVGIGAYSFSPVVLIHSTQPLKDEFFGAVAALSCFGLLALAPLFYREPSAGSRRRALGGAAMVTVAIFCAAGIRWYYAGLMWATLAAVLALFLVRYRTRRLLNYSVAAVALLAAALVGFLAAAGPYGRLITSNLRRLQVIAVVGDVANMTEIARSGFLMSGGATNIVVPLRDDSAAGRRHHDELTARQRKTALYEDLRREELAAAERARTARNAPPGGPQRPTPQSVIDAQEDAARAIPVTFGDQLKTLAAGTSIVLVPTAVLRDVAGIEIPQGRGFLAVADLDTLYLDATIAIVLGLLWRRRRSIGCQLPLVCYSLLLSAVTTVLLGYVVTNFGTLWRMRPLVTIPLWLAALALSPRQSQVATAVAANVNGSGGR